MDREIDTTPRAGWEWLGTLPVAAAVLVGLNGLYMALVALGNITDFDTNQPVVQHVLAMDTTNFGAEPGTNLDPDVMWRAIESEWLQDAAYVAIIAWETATALALLGSLAFWARGAREGYRRARALSTIGLLMLVLLFMGGYRDRGEWFQMWEIAGVDGLDPPSGRRPRAAALIVGELPSRMATLSARRAGPRMGASSVGAASVPRVLCRGLVPPAARRAANVALCDHRVGIAARTHPACPDSMLGGVRRPGRYRFSLDWAR